MLSKGSKIILDDLGIQEEILKGLVSNRLYANPGPSLSASWDLLEFFKAAM